MTDSRRRWLTGLGGAALSGAALAGSGLVPRVARAQARDSAAAAEGELAAAIAAFTGGRPAPPGPVRLDIAELVDNGNTVPLAVAVDGPMDGPGRTVALAVFNERNPQRDVITARFGPRAGRAALDTRIRLATSQKLVAVAAFADGTFASRTVDVVVTLAACIEGETG